jgi:sigma-B regulation protein RsbU (phosphoserine phosphatase)
MNPVASVVPSTILVVDDGPVNLQVLVRTLNGCGHRILAARDGRTALDIARRVRPDLILLDLMMPDVDGFEVCRALKADPETRDIAVIFLSARGEVSDKVFGLKLGAVDYITKPIQTEEVLARVSSHLTRQYLERELRRSVNRLDRELESAGRMQRLLLPSALPSHASVQFAAHYQTSRHAGGDYYDVLPLGDNRFGIMVADVSGHGAPAAIVMSMIRAVLHSYPNPDDPPAVLNHINRHFAYLRDTPMFATAVYAVIDADRHTMRLSCAGHPPPLLLRALNPVAPVPVDAVMPLGIGELPDVPCHEEPLRSGDRVLLYTDGITERQAADGAMYDPERLMSALAVVGSFGPKAIVDWVVADVEAFAKGREPEDDQTVLAVGID